MWVKEKVWKFFCVVRSIAKAKRLQTINDIWEFSAPSKKILLWANFCFVAHQAHATAQTCRHTNSEAF